MGHEGRFIGRAVDADIRVLTDEEQERSGKERRYWLVDHSHWNPGWFFRSEARRMEMAAVRFHAAADAIERFERGEV